MITERKAPTDLQTIGEAQLHASQVLKAAGIANPAFDARLLLAECLNLDMASLFSQSSHKIEANALSRFLEAIEERKTGKPVHRILGFREFYGRTFSFGKDCLEPRPETELLIDHILAEVDKSRPVRFAEIGVGSGAICCSLLAELPLAQAWGSDIAVGAIEATKANGEALGVQDRLTVHLGDCLSGMDGGFDFIVSNPPYIPTSEIETLEKEVRLFDPIAALDGGQDGLDIYRKIYAEGKDHLKQDGLLYLETGHGQHKQLKRIATEIGWGIHACHLDLSGLERILVLRNLCDS